MGRCGAVVVASCGDDGEKEKEKDMAFKKMVEGWRLFKQSVLFLAYKPIFLLPIFFSWIVFATLVLYLRYYYERPDSIFLSIISIYFIIFLISLSICFANVMMLEFMQQMESGKKLSFLKALVETVVVDFILIIPLAMLWAVLWLIIVLIRALTSRKKRNRRPKPSPRDAALALSGVERGPLSLLGLGLDMLEKVIRMMVFMALPAIAWEEEGPIRSIKKAFGILRQHAVQFFTIYAVTGVAAIFMAIPLAVILILDEAGAEFPGVFWTWVILYEGFVWTLGVYLEQMSVGMLYLWHLKWVKNGSVGELSSVPKPNLLDDYYEFLN